MNIPGGTIILVADGSKMLLLQNTGDALSPKLSVLEHQEIDNPANREQLADAPGLNASSMGSGRPSYEKSDPHQDKEDRFAVTAAAALAKAAAESDGGIIVVAPPHTLAILRTHYDRSVQSRLRTEIDKDLTNHPVPDITKLILSYEP